MPIAPFLDIFSPAEEDNSVSSFEYQEYLPQSGIYDDTTTTSWVIDHYNVDRFVLPSRSYIQVEGVVAKNDNTFYAGVDNVAMVNNSGYSIFQRAQYLVDSQSVEEVNEQAVATLIKTLVNSSPDHAHSAGSATGLFMDDTTAANKHPYGNAVITATALQFGGVNAAGERVITHADVNTSVAATYNAGFEKRNKSQVTNDASKKVTFWLPLNKMFGICRVDKVWRGLRHTLKLDRATFDNMFFHDVVVNAAPVNAKFRISKVSWWLPSITPSLSVASALEQRLASGASIPIEYEKTQCYKSDSRTNSSSWRITTQSVKPTKVYIALQLTAKTSGTNLQWQNNMSFDTLGLTSIHMRVNGKQFPSEAIACDYAALTQNWARAYTNLLAVSGKNLDVDSGCLVNYTSFGTLYPVYCFDLTTIDDSVFGQVVDLEVRTTLTADTAHVIYAVVESESKILLRGTAGNKMIIEQL